VERFLDGGFTQGAHPRLPAGVEEPGAVGLLGNEPSELVGDGQNLKDAIASTIAGLTAMQRSSGYDPPP
jgi:hypothetical protein